MCHIASDNEFTPVWCQAITRNNDSLFSFGPLRTNFRCNFNQDTTILFKNIVWKLAAILSQPQCAFNSLRPSDAYMWHWFRRWLGTDQATSHHPNQCWYIVNWAFRTNLSEIIIESQTFNLNKCFWNLICKMAAVCPGSDELKKTYRGMYSDMSHHGHQKGHRTAALMEGWVSGLSWENW